jgi:hypothetical protein
MPSFMADFNELVERLRQGWQLTSSGFEPIYYLVFDPRHILEVKEQTPAWIARLRIEGWVPYTFSVSEAVTEILTASPLRKLWLAAERKDPLAWEKTNQALTNELRKGALLARLEQALAKAAEQPNGLLLVTDLEGLHPYLRIGTLEGQLIGKFQAPTIILYPGKSVGKNRLRFLGFYPEDGNYRFVHIGG